MARLIARRALPIVRRIDWLDRRGRRVLPVPAAREQCGHRLIGV